MPRGCLRALALAGLLVLAGACATPPPPSPPGQPPPLLRRPPPGPVPDEVIAHPTGAVAAVLRIDARDYPFSAIGRLNLGGRGYCSAVLVGPDLVLAAAGCLYNRTEGRWRGRREMFFQAGYQFEKASAQSAIADYAAPAAYRPGKHYSLAGARTDFALLKLERPIGNRAGWLAVAWNDDALEDARLSRRAVIHHAGYTSGRRHVQIIDAGCNVVARACALAGPRLALRPLVERDGAFAAVAVRTRLGAGGPGGLQAVMARLLARLGYAGKMPPAPRPVRATPRRSIALLLRHLGYFSKALASPPPTVLRRAIEAFASNHGRRPGGEPSVGLLAALLRAVQRRGRPAS